MRNLHLLNLSLPVLALLAGASASAVLPPAPAPAPVPAPVPVPAQRVFAMQDEQAPMDMSVNVDTNAKTNGGGLSGTLRRFTGADSVREVLAAAQAYDLDIWHTTPDGSVIDIYTPPDADALSPAPSLPPALARLAHQTTLIPITPPPYARLSTNQAEEGEEDSTEWNITTLASTPFHDTYHPLNQTYSFLQALARKYPEVMRVESIGRSVEGREVLGVRVGLGVAGNGTQGSGSLFEDDEKDRVEVNGKKGEHGEGVERTKRKKRPAAEEGEKLAFVIVGAQHAREWVATATASYLAHALVANHTEPHSLRRLLTHFDFHIIPVPNPDGYAYTWETDRFWYKNRQVTSAYSKCVGLDMNRNWGYKWSGAAVEGGYLMSNASLNNAVSAEEITPSREHEGIIIDVDAGKDTKRTSRKSSKKSTKSKKSKSSKKSKKSKKDKKSKKSKKDKKTKHNKDHGKDSKDDEDATSPRPPPANPCSHWYPGTRAFESPEVNAIANYVATIPNLVGFVGLRSYGQMLSSPYSYSCSRMPKDAEDQIEAALGATHEIASVHGTKYAVGSLCSNLYAAPGNILDWMYAREAVKYAYVAHLRDTGTYGFSLPEKWLRPTGEETTGLVDYLGRFIAKKAKSASPPS